MKIVTVVGARPQFVKMAFVSRAWPAGVEEVVIHTGQHYDRNMSDVFFEELGIPEPAHHLGVGSGSHGAQTGQMLAGIEAILLEEKPDAMLVYGDTNSTLAGALAAAKLHVPVIHVEAGLRSFDRRMPEEVNRVLTDHVSSLLLAPTQTAIDNLAAEGITEGVQLVGDVMFDALLEGRRLAASRPNPAAALGLDPGYVLCTLHRAENTDDPVRLTAIVAALGQIGRERPLALPLHPRTRAALDRADLLSTLEDSPHVHLLDPVGYLEMVALEADAGCILTDSGGVQKEAYLLQVPCVTMRDTTEWVETLGSWNTLVGADEQAIVAAVAAAQAPKDQEPVFGDGNAGAAMADAIGAFLGTPKAP